MKKWQLLLLAVLLFAGAGWFFLVPHSPPLRETLHLAIDNKVENHDPVSTYSDDGLTLSGQVLEPLYQYHYLKRPYEVIPLIAEGMPEMHDSNTRLVIKIRPAVRYHPHAAFMGKTRTVKAQDFVMAFKRHAFHGLGSPFRTVFEGAIIGFKDYGKSLGSEWKRLIDSAFKLDGVEALDDYTLQIRLKEPEPNLIYYLAMTALAPMPAELVEYAANDFTTLLIGTGPFKLESQTDSEYRLKAFVDYRKDFYPTVGDRYANLQNFLSSSSERIPFLEQIIFHVYFDEELRWQAFLDKKLDILTVPKGLLPKLFQNPQKFSAELAQQGVQLKHFPILANRWLSFNMRDPLWGKNRKLRLAVAHAIDVDSYLERFSQRTNLKAHSLLVPGIPGYHPSKTLPFHFDLNEAKRLLAEAGHRDGRGLPELVYSTRGTLPINIAEGEFVREQLAKIGIKVRIKVLQFSEFLKLGRAGKLQFFTDNWYFDYPDGENILQLLISTNAPGINKSGYSNLEVDHWYNRLRTTADHTAKIELMSQIEEQVFSEAPWVPLMYESSYVVYRQGVRNYRKSSVVRNYGKYIKIFQGENP